MAASRGMGRTASTVGMMEGAFFVGRSELLQWVNNLLQINLDKVEQCASGAVYCQIIDACHPSAVMMRKVNWMAKADHEFIPNYKILQAAFDKLNIERHVDVDKLIRAKYQDNLEFLQWMKCYWEREGSGRRDYDPLEARENRHVPSWARPLGQTISKASAERLGEKENLHPRPMESKLTGLGPPSRRPSSVRPSTAGGKTPRASSTSLLSTSIGSVEDDPAAKGSKRVLEEYRMKVAKQEQDLAEMREMLENLERERDYYFRKLREVEIFCTTSQEHLDPTATAEKIVTDIQGILYAEIDEGDAMKAPA